MILLDTNVVSEVQHPRGAPGVRQRVIATANAAFISSIALSELIFGVRSHRDADRRHVLEGFYRTLRKDFANRVLPVTLDIAEITGEMRAARRLTGRPLALADGLIAATAVVHGLTLWTRNARDFDGLGVALLDPWED